MGLAITKLSGSPKKLGAKNKRKPKKPSRTTKPTTSLTEKYQWNGILSAEDLNPNGLFLPVRCNSRI